MNRLHTLIDGFPRVRILCIGDVMLDKFLYGSVSRISPEAPVPIMKMDRETRMLGGAGNVVTNLCALGCRTTFVSVVGNDGHGRQVRRFLEETCCVPELVECEGYETTVKVRFVTRAPASPAPSRPSPTPSRTRGCGWWRSRRTSSIRSRT